MNNWGGRRDGAGRPKGSKNRKTLEVEETLEKLGCDPIAGLAFIATNDREALGLAEDVPIALRARAYADLAGYVAPKRRATEVSAPNDESLADVVAGVNSMSVTERWLEKELAAIEASADPREVT